jgi:hypothetical protein
MPAYSGSLDYNISTTLPQCYPGDVISIDFRANNSPTSNNFTMSMNEGNLTIDIAPALNGSYPYATSSVDFGNFVAIVTAPNKINLNPSVSAFSGPYYTQIPSFISGSYPNEYTVSSSLFYKYGEIDYSFDPKPNDRLLISSIDGRYQILTILGTQYSTATGLVITTAERINVWFSVNYSQISTILITKKLEDETNIIVKYKKPPGATSYGFLIPDDINLALLQSIGVIQSNVQQQLLSTQQNSG